MTDSEKPQRRRIRTRRASAGKDKTAAPQDASPQEPGDSEGVVRRRRVRARPQTAAAPEGKDAGAAPAPRRRAPRPVEEKGTEETVTGERRERTAKPRPAKSRSARSQPAEGRKAQSRAKGKAPRDKAPAKEPVPDEEPVSAQEDASPQAGTTRLQARRGSRGRGTAAAKTAAGKAAAPRARRGRGTSARTSRRPVGAVDEETRRAIAEGPPRRMLVSVGEERTQIAVLEERTLVEHFVTRKSDVSYVGNIYLGRVQNVLPGMEAAFVDIGKGRNGVLYAGEVDYEDTDFEGELPRIEQALKPGQTVLVQVTKDPMGSKGARLTQRLSVAGRYCVLAPGDGMLGISRKLPDDERERLRKILKSIKPDGYGLIVRTAAEGATSEQLEADVARLERIWSEVEGRAEQAKPLDPVYEEPGLVIRVIRDIFGPEYTDVIVDAGELAQEIRDYLADVAPDLAERVSVHSGDDSLFDAYEVTTQIRRALEKKVWLASGGYLIVEKTEAMWVIDVNTGKFVGSDNLEETVLRNNLEAAEEIARQLRLRDMGGIIVIDFVDMLVPANRDEVLKRFRRELARDKTKSRVMEISKLGLVQMTRKNVSQGLTEVFTKTCDACEGRGAQILDSAFPVAPVRTPRGTTAAGSS